MRARPAPLATALGYLGSLAALAWLGSLWINRLGDGPPEDEGDDAP